MLAWKMLKDAMPTVKLQGLLDVCRIFTLTLFLPLLIFTLDDCGWFVKF